MKLVCAATISCVGALLAPVAAHAYVDCGNPSGPAVNVTAAHVRCGDALRFARKIARRLR